MSLNNNIQRSYVQTYKLKRSQTEELSGAGPGFCVGGGGGGVFLQVFSIIEAILTATLKHFKDVINLI